METTRKTYGNSVPMRTIESDIRRWAQQIGGKIGLRLNADRSITAEPADERKTYDAKIDAMEEEDE